MYAGGHHGSREVSAMAGASRGEGRARLWLALMVNVMRRSGRGHHCGCRRGAGSSDGGEAFRAGFGSGVRV